LIVFLKNVEFGDELGLNYEQQKELLYIHYQTLTKLIFESCPELCDLLKEKNLDKMIFSIFTNNTYYARFHKIQEILEGNFVDIFDIITNIRNFSQKRCDKLLEIANKNSKTDRTKNTDDDKTRNPNVTLSNQKSDIDKAQTSENIGKDFDKRKEKKSCNKNISDYEFVATY
jgi:hypothetical protein